MRFVRPIAKFALVAAAFAGVARWFEERAISRWRKGAPPPDRSVDGEVRFVDTPDGARLRVVELGEGPMIVLAHGIGGRADHWAPIAQNLAAAGFRVVAYDQRGHHHSSRGSDEYTPAVLGADLIEVINSTGRDAIVVAGHSMGGITIQAALSQGLSDVARSVVLVATLHRPVVSAPTDVPDRVFDAFVKLAGHQKHGVAAMRGGFGDHVHYADLDTLRDAWATFDPATFADAMHGLADFDFSEALAANELPTWVICGEADKVTPIGFSEQIAELTRAVEFERLDGIGHMITWEASDAVLDQILAAASMADVSPASS